MRLDPQGDEDVVCRAEFERTAEAPEDTDVGYSFEAWLSPTECSIVEDPGNTSIDITGAWYVTDSSGPAGICASQFTYGIDVTAPALVRVSATITGDPAAKLVGTLACTGGTTFVGELPLVARTDAPLTPSTSQCTLVVASSGGSVGYEILFEASDYEYCLPDQWEENDDLASARAVGSLTSGTLTIDRLSACGTNLLAYDDDFYRVALPVVPTSVVLSVDAAAAAAGGMTLLALVNEDGSSVDFTTLGPNTIELKPTGGAFTFGVGCDLGPCGNWYSVSTTAVW